jgi:hypothetical protein
MMKKFLVAGATLLLATAANAATSFQLTAMEGSWAWGNTQWNNVSGQGYVNNVADVATVNALLQGPYVYSAPNTIPGNGVYNYADDGVVLSSLIVSVNGGVATTLDTLSILSSRSYGSGTTITLDVSSDGGGSWVNVLSSTTGALGWIDVGTGGTETQVVDLSFGGVSGNAFRFSALGDQINVHTFTLNDGGVVPEPASWAMLIAGFGLVGAAARRRRVVAAA